METQIDPIDAELFQLIDDYKAEARPLYRYPVPDRSAALVGATIVLTPEEQALYRACFPDEEEV